MSLTKISKQALVFGALLLANFFTTNAQAAVTTYTDRAAFLAAGASFTTVDFEAQNPHGAGDYVGYNAGPLTIGNVAFQQPNGRLYVFGQSVYRTYGLTSSYLNENCCANEGINTSFAAPVHGVGMDLGIQNTWNSSNLSVTFTLSTGDVITTIAPMLYETSNSMSFFGFYSDVAFTSFNVNGPSNAVSIDNFTYTSRDAQAVPEPGSIALLGLGLAAFGFGRRKFRV